MMKFEVYKQENEEYSFRMVCDTDEILTALNGAEKKEQVIDAIDSIKKNVAIPSSVEKKETASGDYFFTITNSVGKVVCKSAAFYSSRLRDQWINDIQKEVPQLDIVEVEV